MEGKIQVNSGDVSIIAVKVDNKDVTEIPQKGGGKRFDHADCTNGATGNWDSTNWRFLLSGLKQTKTKCTLYFLTGEEPVGGTKIEDKFNNLLNDSYHTDQIVYEQEGNDNNIRFIGINPDNYVTFNGEPWRIVGLMDGIKTSSGNTERLLKIIRNDSLGNYNWDKSTSNINNGWGVNEWSEADLMYALKKYGGESISTCGDSNCPTNWGTLDATAQSMIEEVTWNTGTVNGTGLDNEMNPNYMYKAERSTANGKVCQESASYGGIYCNDNVERKPTWTGKVGLMYLSDYGYATNGGQQTSRKQCLEITMKKWNDNNYCYINDWLLDSSKNQWTMTPATHYSNASTVFNIWKDSIISGENATITSAVRPVVYLKSSVKITGGDGTAENPYTLSAS